MNFKYSDKLKTYMQKTGKKYILVEVVTADTSDIEVSEIATRFVDERMAKHYLEEKHFAMQETEMGYILLPKYPLHYAEVVELSLRSFLFIHLVTQKGMKV